MFDYTLHLILTEEWYLEVLSFYKISNELLEIYNVILCQFYTHARSHTSYFDVSDLRRTCVLRSGSRLARYRLHEGLLYILSIKLPIIMVYVLQ